MKLKFNFKLALLCTLLSILSIIIFRTMKELSVGSYIAAIVIYSLLTLATAAWYIFYNRGIFGKVDPDLLPNEWSEEQKDAFIGEIRDRRKRSKWAIILLTPLIFTFFYEALDIYVLQGILANLASA